LRDATRAELGAYIEGRRGPAMARQLEPALAGSALEAPLLSPQAVDGGPSSNCPFAHPLYWGAFILTGL